MFDLARVLALGWALLRSLRVPRSGARRPLVLVLLATAAGIVVLQVESGLARSAAGPLDAAYAALMLAVGPSYFPGGPLPAIADLIVAVATGLVSGRLRDHAADLPLAQQDEALRWSRLSLAVALVFVLQLLSLLVRVGPALLRG